MTPDGSECFAIERIDAVGHVSIRAEEQPDGWTINLRLCSGPTTGPQRLRLAASRLVELDAATGLALASGSSIERRIGSEPQSLDGPHAAAEQVIPLLLPLRVEDSLYAYQRTGVAWLLKHDRALLADDMGLGKTAQAVASSRRLIRAGKIAWVLVVCPRTLIANWAAELRYWAPELSVATAIATGSGRGDRWRRVVRRAHIVLTTYEQLRQPPEALLQHPPPLVIADEAHRLRKADALSTRGFRRLDAVRIWALTGTPLERDAEDLAVLLSLLDPSRFSSDDKALHRSALRSRLRPYLLRRRKDEVLGELPPVVESNEILDLTDEQRQAYRRATQVHSKANAKAGFLPLFNKLRSICDVDEDTGASSKLDRVVELLTDIRRSNEKAVVFSYVLEPIRQLGRRLEGAIPYEVITGEMSLEDREVALHRFRKEGACTALLASTRVAGEGLTLTEANHVIFINRWWNPSANNQARDRVSRIGQRKVVQVWSFTCRKTVEDSLGRLLAEKSLSFEELIEELGRHSVELFRQA